MMQKITALILAIALFVAVSINDKPQSTIILAGGATLPEEIYNKFNSIAENKIVIIPSGLKNPENIPERWKTAKILHVKSKHEINNDIVKLIQKAKGVWILGGDQLKLSELYNNTPVEYEIRNLLKRGGVVGGTSAGASVFSDIMIYENTYKKGFGIIDFVIDQHFSERKRLPRLINLLKKFPEKIGIGIDECTALIIQGNDIKVIGKGSVYICSKNTIQQKSNNDTINLK